MGPRRMPTAAAIYQRWKGTYAGQSKSVCFACGFDAAPYNCERAHIVPRFKGGADDVSNLHMLCHTCHRHSEFWLGDDDREHDQVESDYFAWIDEARERYGLGRSCGDTYLLMSKISAMPRGTVFNG